MRQIDYMKEIWRIIPETNGWYSVSNFGRVKSHDRIDNLGRSRKGQLLSQSTKDNGYKVVQLGRERQRYVHRLVALAFVGIDETLHVNHKDGNKSNNSFENLELVSRSENDLHKKRFLETNRYPVLDTETGIYYANAKEVFETFGQSYGWGYCMFKYVIQGVKTNNRRFLRCAQ